PAEIADRLRAQFGEDVRSAEEVHGHMTVAVNPERYREIAAFLRDDPDLGFTDRKSTRLNSSHVSISYAVFCLKKKKIAARERRIYLPTSQRPTRCESHDAPVSPAVRATRLRLAGTKSRPEPSRTCTCYVWIWA